MLSTEQSGHNLTKPDHWAEVPRAAIQLPNTHFPNRKGQNGHIPPPATSPNAHWPWCHELTVQGRQHPSLGASENENMCSLKHWMKAGQRTNQTAQARASTGAVGGKGLHSGGHNKKSEVHCLPGSPTLTYWFNSLRFAYWNYSKCTIHAKCFMWTATFSHPERSMLLLPLLQIRKQILKTFKCFD